MALNTSTWRNNTAKLGVVAFLLLFVACNQPNQGSQVASSSPTSSAVTTTTPDTTSQTAADTTSATYTVNTFFDKTTLWGYEILKDGKAVIRQQNIPAVSGNNGFSTQEKAEKVGKFVAHKLQNGIFPPSVTKEELDSLGAL